MNSQTAEASNLPSGNSPPLAQDSQDLVVMGMKLPLQDLSDEEKIQVSKKVI